MSVTTVLLAGFVDDPHEPDSSSAYWAGQERIAVVGTVPEDPCLVGADDVMDRLQTTGMMSVGHARGGLPELLDNRVLAVVWSAHDELNLVGGAFWRLNDEGNGGDGVHPPDAGDGAGDLEDDSIADQDRDEEPRPVADWVDRAFVPAETVRLEPGTYTVEVWANPNGLPPSDDPYIPAESAERHCTMEVEVTAGTHLDVFVGDFPTDGGECPHSTKFRDPPSGPGI